MIHEIVNSKDIVIQQKNTFTKQIVINADDLGWNEKRDQGIFELLEGGYISSATAMVNGYNSKISIEQCRKKNIPLGMHLNLTEGEPIYLENIENNTLVSVQKQNYIQNESGKIQDIAYIMHGKFGFRERISQNKITKLDMQKEIRAQIETFIDWYGAFPTHIDGHMHIHTLPLVAETLAEIMANEYGIYKTRLPIERLELLFDGDLTQHVKISQQQREFYQSVVDTAVEAKSIFDKFQIFSTDAFLGMGFMGLNCQIERFQNYFENIFSNLQENENKKIKSVEIMCHPGYPTERFGCEFNQSTDRVHEIDIYKSEQFNSLLKKFNFEKVSFKTLTRSQQKENYSICIYSSLSPYTGNSTSSLRIQCILQSLGYRCLLRGHTSFSKENEESMINERKEFYEFCENENIGVILGMNVYRSGLIMRGFQKFKQNGQKIKISYIISGTDANEATKSNSKTDIMRQALQNCDSVVSMNEQMRTIFTSYFPDLFEENANKKLPIYTVPQSFYNFQSLNSEFNIRKHLKIPEDNKIILLTAGIRPVKDVCFTLQETAEVLKEYQNYIFLHVGPILTQNSYEEYQSLMIQIYDESPQLIEKMRYLGTLSHDIYLALLRESHIFLNSSLSEGMCTSIVEALSNYVPVIARINKGNCELIQHNETGLLFETQNEYKDNLISLIQNKDSLHTKLAQKGFEFSQKIASFEAEQKAYLLILQDLEQIKLN